MLLESILRALAPIKGFVYRKVVWTDETRRRLLVHVEARRGSRGHCSGCGRKGPGYDRQAVQHWEFVPCWNLPLRLSYAPRRIDCRRCGGPKVELLPWSEGKSRQTTSYRWFLAGWAKKLSWQEVARSFGTSWDSVYRSVQMAVAWGLAHRDLSGIEAIGVDEVAWQKGHRYLTVVYQIRGVKRLLWVAEHRKLRSLLGFFRMLGPQRSAQLKYVCSDMWRAYLTVIARKAKQATHVLDRYHIVAKMNQAIDEVRAAEARRLVADGHEPVLKHSRWCLLKRAANRTAKQTAKLADLMKYNLKTVKAYLLKEEFQRFWDYRSVPYAARFLVEWCRKTRRTKIEPMVKVANTIETHAELILNYIDAKGMISAGIVEGLNNKLKLHTKRAYGFRSYDAIQTALYHGLGALPEPNHTHRFC